MAAVPLTVFPFVPTCVGKEDSAVRASTLLHLRFKHLIDPYGKFQCFNERGCCEERMGASLGTDEAHLEVKIVFVYLIFERRFEPISHLPEGSIVSLWLIMDLEVAA